MLNLTLMILFSIIKLSHSNEIIITIKGMGDQRILSDEFYSNELIDEIIIMKIKIFQQKS